LASLTSGSDAASSDAGADNQSAFLTDLQSLVSAVQSGDSSSAREIASGIESRLSAPPPPPPPPPQGDAESSSSSSSSSSFVSDLVALLDAVQSGDASSAQTAATSFGSDLAALLGTSSDDATISSSASSSSSTSSTIVDDLKALIAEAKSGDVGSAQSSADTLLKDLREQGTGRV
jgi:hypothetical protein